MPTATQLPAVRYKEHTLYMKAGNTNANSQVTQHQRRGINTLLGQPGDCTLYTHILHNSTQQPHTQHCLQLYMRCTQSNQNTDSCGKCIHRSLALFLIHTTQPVRPV